MSKRTYASGNRKRQEQKRRKQNIAKLTKISGLFKPLQTNREIQLDAGDYAFGCGPSAEGEEMDVEQTARVSPTASIAGGSDAVGDPPGPHSSLHQQVVTFPTLSNKRPTFTQLLESGPAE